MRLETRNPSDNRVIARGAVKLTQPAKGGREPDTTPTIRRRAKYTPLGCNEGRLATAGAARREVEVVRVLGRPEDVVDALYHEEGLRDVGLGVDDGPFC